MEKYNGGRNSSKDNSGKDGGVEQGSFAEYSPYVYLRWCAECKKYTRIIFFKP